MKHFLLALLGVALLLHGGHADPALPANAINLDGSATFYYEFTADNNVNMALKYNNYDWFAISLGADIASNDAVTVWKNGDKYVVEDRWADANSTMNLDTAQSPAGKEDNVFNNETGLYGDFNFVLWSRKTDTGDQWDRVLAPGQMNIIWVGGSGTPFQTQTKHGNISFSFDSQFTANAGAIASSGSSSSSTDPITLTVPVAMESEPATTETPPADTTTPPADTTTPPADTTTPPADTTTPPADTTTPPADTTTTPPAENNSGDGDNITGTAPDTNQINGQPTDSTGANITETTVGAKNANMISTGLAGLSAALVLAFM